MGSAEVPASIVSLVWMLLNTLFKLELLALTAKIPMRDLWRRCLTR
jgi:hypothetical protein